MGLVETEALILKSYSLADADKIVVFLTENEGLVRGVARGAKRLKSRFGAGLEISSIVNLTYFQKEEKELVSIREVELLKSFFSNAVEPEFFEKFAYIVQLLVEFAQPHDPNERLYRMTNVCLETAKQNPKRFDDLIFYFELWLLKLGGYLPDWTNCNICRRQFKDGESSNFLLNLHLACLNCQKSKNQTVVSARQREIFLAAQKYSPAKFLDFTKNQTQDVRDLSTILRRVITNILGREIGEEKKITAGNK